MKYQNEKATRDQDSENPVTPVGSSCCFSVIMSWSFFGTMRLGWWMHLIWWKGSLSPLCHAFLLPLLTILPWKNLLAGSPLSIPFSCGLEVPHHVSHCSAVPQDVMDPERPAYPWSQRCHFVVCENISVPGDEDFALEDLYPVSCWGILCILLSLDSEEKTKLCLLSGIIGIIISNVY